MKLTDITLEANKFAIDDTFINKVETIYSCKLPYIVKHILCIPDGAIDYGDRTNSMHKLPNDLVLTASEEMHSDFIGNHLLPIFDIHENDYVCYDFLKNTWCMFHTVGDYVFNGSDNLSELFESKNEIINSSTSDNPNLSMTKQSKSRAVALLLFLFLYIFGAHFFYLGQKKKAFIQIGLSIVGITFYTIWALQTNFGTQGGSIFYGMSWMLVLVSWVWGLINTLKLTKNS